LLKGYQQNLRLSIASRCVPLGACVEQKLNVQLTLLSGQFQGNICSPVVNLGIIVHWESVGYYESLLLSKVS